MYGNPSTSTHVTNLSEGGPQTEGKPVGFVAGGESRVRRCRVDRFAFSALNVSLPALPNS